MIPLPVEAVAARIVSRQRRAFRTAQIARSREKRAWRGRGLMDTPMPRGVGHGAGERREDVKHGVCRSPECGRRTILWLPAALCERCLMAVQQAVSEALTDEQRQMMLAELDDMEAADAAE